MHPFQRQAQFYQRDRHRRLHPHHHRYGIHDLGTGTVQRTDDGHGQDAVPYLDDGSRNLVDFLILAVNNLLSAFNVHFKGNDTQAIQQPVEAECFFGDAHRIILILTLKMLQHDFFKAKNVATGGARV